MGLDPLQIHLPAKMLAVNVPYVYHEERVFLSSITDVGVDSTNTLFQDIFRKMLSVFFAMIAIMIDAQ